MPAALFARVDAKASRRGSRISTFALLLIVDHQLRLVRRGRVLGRAEDRRHVRALPASLIRQPKFEPGLLISASTSAVTVTDFVALLVVPVVNVAKLVP